MVSQNLQSMYSIMFVWLKKIHMHEVSVLVCVFATCYLCRSLQERAREYFEFTLSEKGGQVGG